MCLVPAPVGKPGLALRLVPVVVLVALGGVLGALGRYALALALPSGDWPWATLTVNLVGSLAIGLLVPRLPDGSWRPFLVTGVLGGFTTFSALAIETTSLIDGGRAPLALAYVLVTVVGGLALAGAGARLAGRRA